MDHIAGAGHQHVEPPSAACASERAEVAPELALWVGPEGGRDDDVIAFVALDVFQVLDEKTLEGPRAPAHARRCQPRRELLVRQRRLVEQVEHQLALSEIEARHADRRWFRLG